MGPRPPRSKEAAIDPTANLRCIILLNTVRHVPRSDNVPIGDDGRVQEPRIKRVQPDRGFAKPRLRGERFEKCDARMGCEYKRLCDTRGG
jgi:hypothetical protein